MCGFSHSCGQPGLGGQYLALQYIAKDQNSTIKNSNISTFKNLFTVRCIFKSNNILVTERVNNHQNVSNHQYTHTQIE